MTKTNKILIGILLISSLLLGIGYSAIENITLNIGGTATAIVTEFSAETLNTNCYGGYVTNYKATNGCNIGWRIFHSDGENIYLIADDYIERTYVPVDLNGKVNYITTNTTTKWHFGIYCRTNYDYISIIDSDIKDKWLKKYVKSGFAGTKYNMGVTAYLLDTSLWSGFKDSDGYAKYAVGAATLELFVESYNRTHPDKIIETQVENEKGYQVKWRSDNNYSYSISGVDADNNLYVINDNTKARACWIASPSSGNKYGNDWGEFMDMYNIRYNNMVDNEMCETCTRGSRPIVCLNSNVKLKLQDENTYFIMD